MHEHRIAKSLSLVVVIVGSSLAVPPAAAQPTIASVSGTLSHNSTVVISGISFGTKSTAAPKVWETFDDGSLTDLTEHSPGGMVYNNGNNLRHQFATFNARANYKIGGGGHYFGYDGTTAAKWFVQYWIKLASNWQWGTSTYGGGDDGLANIKIFRLYPTGSRTYSNVGYSLHSFAGGDVLRFTEIGASTYLGVDGRNWFTPNVWHSVQVEFAENSGVDQNNGTMRLWVDGVLRDSTTTLNTNVGSDGAAVNKRPYVIGWYDSWSPSDSAASTMYAYYSDIYVDTTWSRVEIGNASTYNACTRREIQPTTAWSASSVTVKVNQGSFLNGQTAYLYVVNSSGQVNAAGLPVVIAGSATPPSAPTGLHVVP